MPCNSQNKLNKTNGASGDDGEEWTEVPSQGGSSSSTSEEAEASSTETIVEVPDVQARGLVAWVKSNTSFEVHLRGWKKGSGKKISILVLKGGSAQDREDCASEIQRLSKIFSSPKGKKSDGKKSKETTRTAYEAPASLFFGVVKPFAEKSGVKCHPLGKNGTMSRYGLTGKTLEERDAIAQQVSDHCAELLSQKPFRCPSSKAVGALKMVLGKPEFKGSEFCIVVKDTETCDYILIGGTSVQHAEISHAVTMQCVQWIMRDEEEAEMDFYTVPADQAFGAINATYKAQFKPSKWGGVTKSEQVEYELKGFTDKKRTLSRYILTGGTPKSQADFVAKVNANANKYKRGDKARKTVAKEAAVLSKKEEADYAKFTREQRDPERYFELRDARKATTTKSSNATKPPTARGPDGYCGGGPAEENQCWLEAQRKSKQEKQAAQTVRAYEKQQKAELEKQKAAEAAAIKAELEKREAAEAAAHSRAIVATNPFAVAFGVDSDDEDVAEPPRTANEDVTEVLRAVTRMTPVGAICGSEVLRTVTRMAPVGAWSRGAPVVRVVEEEFSQQTPEGTGVTKVVTFPADDEDCGDWETVDSPPPITRHRSETGEWFN